MSGGAIEHPSFLGAAANADGRTDAGEGDRRALHVAQAIGTVSLQVICAHCGKQGAVLKRCSVCKNVWYCGAACQNAAWKRHKKTCAPPLSTDDVREKVLAASSSQDWVEVLKWEGRMEEMMEGQPDASCRIILQIFEHSHSSRSLSTGSLHHAISAIRLGEDLVALLGKMERFRDQGKAMCDLATTFNQVDKRQEAAEYYQKARKVGEAHGFFSVECRACLGLGNAAMFEGRDEEGLDLLRNALAALPLSEDEGLNTWELHVLSSLIDALFKTHAVAEVEPLVLRYREAIKAKSARGGNLCNELRGILFRAKLHEVLSIQPCAGKPSKLHCLLHSIKADSVCYRTHPVREKSTAILEPVALSRHAGGLKRPSGTCALCSTSCARTRHQCHTSVHFKS